MRKQTTVCQRSGKEGRDSLQRAVGDVCTFLRTLIGIKFTFLGALIGIRVHMSSTLPGTGGMSLEKELG